MIIETQNRSNKKWCRNCRQHRKTKSKGYVFLKLICMRPEPHECKHKIKELFIFLPRQPPVGHDLLIHKVSRSHTTTHHSRWDSSGRVISSSQKPLPDNTQHARQTSMLPVGFEPTISAGERPQTYALDHAATGTGKHKEYRKLKSVSPSNISYLLQNTVF